MSEEQLSIIKDVYERFNSRNYAGVLELFDENFEWNAAENSPLADKSPYHGVDAVRIGVFDRIAAGFEKLEVAIDEMFASGERVVVLGYYHARFQESQDEFQIQVAHIWTIRDGKAVKFQQYVDTLKIAQKAQANAVSG